MSFFTSDQGVREGDIMAQTIGPMLGPMGMAAAGFAQARQTEQTRQIAEKGLSVAGTMDIRAKRREAALRGELARQRTKDLYASTALARRLSNAALEGMPRAGGSVLGGRGRKYR